MYTLQFKDNFDKQHDGLNTTCRLGPEHGNNLRVGQTIKLEDVDTGFSRNAFVCDTHVNHIKDVPGELILLEHDPDLRDRESIRKAMAYFYEQDVTMDSLISVITYVII